MNNEDKKEANETTLKSNYSNTPSPKPIPTLQPIQMLQYSSPFPPPEIMAKYHQLGVMEKIINMAENESNNRHIIENKKIDAEIKQAENNNNRSLLGQIFAFLTILITVGTATALAILGHETVATAISAIGLTGIVSAFLNKYSNNKEK